MTRTIFISALALFSTALVVRMAAAAPWRLELRRFFTPDATGAAPADPFLANGVALGSGLASYTAAGTGPSALNELAPADTAAQYIDYTLLSQLFPGFAPSDADKAAGLLPEGMSITEAQGLNCMARVRENLEAADLSLSDITFMRIYLDNPQGAERADYAGWNRAYRKFLANVDLQSGALIEAYAPVLFETKTRPARSNIEVATLPVLGWLIEIEVVAAYPLR